MIHICNTKKIALETEKGCAVALGKFDGFHKGHMVLVDEIRRLQERGYTGVLFTFDIKKNHVFDVDKIKNIYTSDEKLQLVEQFGIDAFVEYPFDDTFAAMKPEAFVKKILVDEMHVKYVVVGKDYRFGKDRAGDVSLLENMGKIYGFAVLAMDKLSYENKIVSATYIRQCILEGNMEEIPAFLGRNYSVSGCVFEGKRLGRTIGIPTANLLPEKGKIYPPEGVYVSKISIAGEADCYYGITNIGDNPTVNDTGSVTIETNIFDFDRDIYKKAIRIEFLSYIRGEKKFSGVEELKKQLCEDIVTAKKWLQREFFMCQ